MNEMSAECVRRSGRVGPHIWMHKTATVRGRLMGIRGCLHCGEIEAIWEMTA